MCTPPVYPHRATARVALGDAAMATASNDARAREDARGRDDARAGSGVLFASIARDRGRARRSRASGGWIIA